MNSSMVVSYSNNLPLEAVKVNSWLKIPLLFRQQSPHTEPDCRGKNKAAKMRPSPIPPFPENRKPVFAATGSQHIVELKQI